MNVKVYTHVPLTLSRNDEAVDAIVVQAGLDATSVPEAVQRERVRGSDEGGPSKVAEGCSGGRPERESTR